MIYKVDILQTIKGSIFIDADSYKEAEEAADKYIKEEPNVASIDFDEIQDYTVWEALELFDDDISDVEVIKAEDVL
nr:MAG TPA: PcfM DpnD/PcfM-like protein [Caudoviricetes sp.]DAX51337.1 MAG TPA: PcfM DpnD/PcfM-like protein [Caudoviricetes sp.]